MKSTEYCLYSFFKATKGFMIHDIQEEKALDLEKGRKTINAL